MTFGGGGIFDDWAIPLTFQKFLLLRLMFKSTKINNGNRGVVMAASELVPAEKSVDTNNQKNYKYIINNYNRIFLEIYIDKMQFSSDEYT